jgi:hypothetical protein
VRVDATYRRAAAIRELLLAEDGLVAACHRIEETLLV